MIADLSEANWAALIMVFNGLGLAFIAYLTNARAIKTESEVVLTKAKVVETKAKVEEVLTVVDGPLSVALENNALLARRLANETGRPEDEIAAVKAEAIDKNRKDAKKE